MKDFFKSLIFILMPHYWLMNERYSKLWDDKLNNLMDEYEFKIESQGYIATLGTHRIWICNYPYSCFELLKDDSYCSGFGLRPSRLTILRAWKKLKIETGEYKKPSDFSQREKYLIIQLEKHD